jgi:hypothetical protein
MMATNQFDHRGPNPKPTHAHTKRTKTARSQLGVDFQPSKYSVICGRGKSSYDHTGNHHLRTLTSKFAADYSKASRKLKKSAIVANIVAVIRKIGGRFCKYEKGAWFEVGDHFAREKVSAMFRDMLHTQYRSSAKAKTARRRVQIKRIKTQTQQDSQQLVEGTGHSDDSSAQQYSQQLIHGTGDWDDSSISSSWSGSSTDSLGFDHSLGIDFFDIEVF